MILQALFQLAQREGLVEDPDFEWKRVPWIARIDLQGRLLGIESTHYTPPVEPGSRRKPKPVAKQFRMPREPARAMGDRPFLLCDKAEYAFGIAPADKDEAQDLDRAARRFAVFKKRVADCWLATGDEGVKAVATLLAQIESRPDSLTLPDDYDSADLIAFALIEDVDQLITDRQSVRDYWRGQRLRTPAKNGRMICLVTGQRLNEASLFKPVKRMPGATTSGAPLVSFNKAAFMSYGWAGRFNAPVSREAAEAASEALVRLVDPTYPDPRNPGQALPKRHLRITADTLVCYWAASEAGDSLAEILGGLLDEDTDASRVSEQYRSIWRGKAAPIKDPTAFYALVLTGAQGRLVVREWIESSVGDAARNLAQHFADLELPGWVRRAGADGDDAHISLRSLVAALAPQGREDQVPGAVVGQIVDAALYGTGYPISILQRALLRARAEIGQCSGGGGLDAYSARRRMDARTALVKAILNRRFRQSGGRHMLKEVSPMMDPNLKSPGYLFGRLLALVERIQQEALGDVNASVVDRFFAGASATPRAVFPRLLKNVRHHVRRAKDNPGGAGRVVWLERLLDDVLAGLPAEKGFPTHLDLEQQGLFLLGYHQMRKWLWLGSEERQTWAAQFPDAPRVYQPASNG